ncbi:DUF937 domain-containing protein [Aquabacterium fontiphilum]|jgi:uncharacterized protein YidB (DUF937 family)|uniref:YidB family protein n=1 Tax=Aquabacterium fontiphilum TaxID=450365 RepID=UPI001377BFB7|nr:YidB family protein [Aquabacterium fontiphilum]NBD21165.1 DUF937 domain-containing protein [Aquabacterium fontiphilum]
MGLLNQLTGGVVSALATGDNSGMGQPGAVITLATQLLNAPEFGGLPGLIKTFEDKGYGELVASWIGQGRNMPVTADQIMTVLGKDFLARLAQGSGNTPEQEAAVISEALPQLIDRLTPDGVLPDQQQLSALVANVLTSDQAPR